MKKVTALILGIFLIGISAKASSNKIAESALNFYDGNSYIFVEDGVEFSVFPDGQFDFVFLGRSGNGVNVNVNVPGVNVSFNAGYNYDAYVQYDDYGAVIQIENVPIYYDEFGRITQAGSVDIRYRDRRIVRVGGLRVFYNNYGYFDYCTGFVSPFYRTYVYRPWHVYYARPLFASCIVYDYPYRRFYRPTRFAYNYHRNNFRTNRSYINGRRSFYRPGSRVHYRNGRTAVNRSFDPNRRNTAVDRGSIRDRGNSRGIAQNTRPRADRGISRSDRADKGVTRGDTREIGRSNDARRTTGREITRPKRGDSRVERPSTNRGIAKTNSRGISRPKSRGISKPSSRSGKKVAQKRSSGKRSSVNRNRVSRKSNSKGYSAPKRSSVKRNTPSRSKGSVKRGNTSRSRGSAPKRGRGI